MAKKKKKGNAPFEAMRETIINDYVILPNTAEIFSASVQIGDIDQTGSTRIELRNDPDFPARNIDGTFNMAPIAECRDMSGKILLITTSVTDTNLDTQNNRVEATLRLFNGNEVKLVKRLRSDVTNDGDTETFIFNIYCYAN